MTDVTALAAQLESHDDYRVLRRLVPTERFVPESSAHQLRHALVVDVETTGTDKPSDVIIELGIVRFTYDALTGQPVQVLAAESMLEDPGRPIPAEIVALTGITDDMVRGKRIDEGRVLTLLDGVGIVFAHNAGFDRPFVERRLPAFKDVHWGCTQRDIDWRALGVGSHGLKVLVYKHLGAFFDGHRAVDDCRATLALLATRTADGTLPMAKLLNVPNTARARMRGRQRVRHQGCVAGARLSLERQRWAAGQMLVPRARGVGARGGTAVVARDGVHQRARSGERGEGGSEATLGLTQ